MPNTIVKIFDNSEFGALRVTKDADGEPWFVAKDVCRALGFSKQHDATKYLDPDEKGGTNCPTPGGIQKMNTVSEGGLYTLIFHSRKPEAHAFKRWVTHEVLPSIRQDGGYIAAGNDESDEQVMARALRIADKTIKARDERIAELEPKARFADAVAASDSTCLIADLAKILTQNGYIIGQNRLFEQLRQDGYLGTVGGHRNVPTQKAMEMGLFRIKEFAVTHSDGHVSLCKTPRVTGKGQRYFVAHYCEARA